MIVPATRLIVASFVVLVPAATIAGVAPAIAPQCALAALLFVILALIDARGAWRSVSLIDVAAPEQVRLIQDAPSVLRLTLTNHLTSSIPVRVGIVEPAGLSFALETARLTVPAGTPFALDWACTGTLRGDHTIDAVHLETTSPFGLWLGRGTRAVRTKLRVFPSLRDRATMTLLRRTGPGARIHRHIGKGREFEKLREYLPGDSYEDVHWKATAKRGYPVVKLFQVEQSQEVYIVIDQSRLTARENILEDYVNAALHLALAAQRQGDRFGLITFSDRAHRIVRAHNGAGHFRICRETIYNLQPHRVNPDFRELFTSLQLNLKRRSLLVFLTALDDPLLAEEFEREVAILSRRHVVLVNTMQTAATRPLFSGAAPATLDDAYDALSGQVLWNRLRTLQGSLRNRGVRLEIVRPEEIKQQVTAAYLEIKRRQLL